VRNDNPGMRQIYEFVDEIAAILFIHDFAGLSQYEQRDEYIPEAEGLVFRLHTCRTEADVRRLTHMVFVRMFSRELVGPEHRFTAAAREIWQLWCARTGRSAG
jgi:hypothetical protein